MEFMGPFMGVVNVLVLAYDYLNHFNSSNSSWSRLIENPPSQWENKLFGPFQMKQICFSSIFSADWGFLDAEIYGYKLQAV